MAEKVNRGVWAVFFFILIAGGCSAAAKDKLLRTFIDGVPPKEGEQKAGAAVSKPEKKTKEPAAKTEESKAPPIIFHVPFAEQMCDSCHDSKFSQKLITTGSELCFTCHDNFTKDKAVVHYPAGEGLCVDCHEPHQSLNKSLLKEPVPALCFTCHDEKDVMSQMQHEGQNNCLECHEPHASNEEKLLK